MYVWRKRTIGEFYDQYYSDSLATVDKCVPTCWFVFNDREWRVANWATGASYQLASSLTLAEVQAVVNARTRIGV